MTIINLLPISVPEYHSQATLQIKGTQAQHTNLGMHHPHWNDYNIKILNCIKLKSIKLQ